MRYLLDTDTCIYFLKDSYPSVADRIEQTPTMNIRLPSVVTAELLYGAEKSTKRPHSLAVLRTFLTMYEIVPFDDKCAVCYAVIRAGLERKGRIIGANDLLIAATAVANNGILVTHNTGEFSRIPGLLLEDWVRV